MPDSDEPKLPKVVFRRSRGRFRLSYILAVLSACVMFACAGCCLLSPFFLGAQRYDGDSGATKVASEVIEWKLPTAFRGVVGITIDNSAFRLDIARFSQEKGRGTLVIAKAKWRAWHPPNDQDIRKKILEDLIEWAKPELRKIDVKEHETRTLVVCGLSGECEIGHGEDRASTVKYRQAAGYFHDETADAYLILQGEDEYLSGQEIDEFLNSIK